MKRSRLPLTALRSFEVAGRLQSFTLAAAELHISQAAVSRQVRELENLLGRPLFERSHRKVSLTTAGNELLSVLTGAFDDIGTALDQAGRGDTPATVIVSAEPSFASAWLVRNLAAFRKKRPDIDLVIDADPRLVEFRAAGATVAIRHSADKTGWPRTESRHLADVRMIPVAAPHLIARQPALLRPSDLLRLPLLHEENRDLWQRWFAATGTEETINRGIVYTDGGLILQAALQGEGVALLDELFVRDDIRAGRLIRPFEFSIPHGAYWLVARTFTGLPEETAAFIRWLEMAMTDEEPVKST